MTERESLYLWQLPASGNATADPSINWAEGQLPATVNNSAREMMAAVTRFLRDTNGSLTTTGSANAYVLSIWGTQAAYATGHILSFEANFTNTAAATINVSNADVAILGAKSLRVISAIGDSPLLAGQIVSGGRYIIQYSATANSAAGGWIVLNPNIEPSVIIGTTAIVPTIVYVGDSITAGTGGTHPYNFYITPPTYNGQSFTSYNIGVGGRQIVDMLAQASVNLNPLFSARSGMNIAVVLGGTNDIFAVGGTTYQTYSYIERFCRYLKQIGWRVIVVTMPSSTAIDTDRNTVNGFTRTNWVGFADGIADVGANATVGALGAYTNSTYFNVDGIHPKDAGYTIIAGIVQTAIETLVAGNRGQYVASPTNDSARAGNIGEFIDSGLVTVSTSLSNGVSIDATFIDLSPGDWRVNGVLGFTGGATTTVTALAAGISTTSATLPSNSSSGIAVHGYGASAAIFASRNSSIPVGPVRMSVAATTRVYLVARADFGTSFATLSNCQLTATRAR